MKHEGLTQEKLEEIKKAISESSESSKIYIGSDSIVRKKNKKEKVVISTVVVIHKDGDKGCKVIGYKAEAKNTDYSKDKPYNRMMAETEATVNIVQELISVIGDRKTEIHLDINPDEQYGSSVAVKSALGWVSGMFPTSVYRNITHFVKPDSWCATHAADWYVRKSA